MSTKNNKKSKNNKKTKYNIKRIVLVSVTGTLVIAALVWLCVFLSNKGNNSNKPVKDKNDGHPEETVDVNEYVSQGEYIKINLNDCALYVGSVLKLKCTSEPVEYANGVIWSTTDDSVVSVDANGSIKVLKEGVAAITATHGVLTDSVIIKAISANQTLPQSESLPIYEILDGEIVTNEPVSQETQAPVETEFYIPPTSHEDPFSPVTQAPQKESDSQNETQLQETTPYIEMPTTAETEEMRKEALKATVNEAINNSGFTTYLEGAYVFYEDGIYLGEIIMEDDYIHIYVMLRTTTFDAAIKNILATILPSCYEDVFAGFVSASKDSTRTVDGHRVRVVAPIQADHSQLIVFF